MNPALLPSEKNWRKHPRQCAFNEVLASWDDWDNKARNADARAALCLEDRYYLLINVLHRKDAWHPWVYARCREVEKEPDGFLDIWARGHYKSTIITYAGVIQEVLRNPELTVGIFSHTNPIAKAFLAQIKREFESNEDLKILFPKVLYENPERDAPCWSLDAGIIVKRKSNPKESTIEAHGLVDGQPTSRHFGLMVYDDVVTDRSVYTAEQITRTTEAWSLSNNLGSRETRKWHVGTRYSFADSYSVMMALGAVTDRVHPATDNGKIDGNPVLLTTKQWEAKKKQELEATIACQSLCNPLAGHQRMFNVEDVREYEIRPETLMVYLMVDPARSIKKDSDHTAMVVLGLDHAGNKYLLDGFDHKMDLMERWGRMRDLQDKWSREAGIQGVVVGYERYGAIADLDYFHERMKVERAHFPITELEWPREGPGSKNDRVQRLTPDLRGHRFYVPRETDPDNLTTTQRKAKDSGYGYRVARRIRALDENKELYDVTERLKLQISFFPFGQRVDLVDALSRIYDLEPETPVGPVVPEDMEPEMT